MKEKNYFVGLKRLLVFFLLTTTVLLKTAAQERNISGTVTDASTGETLVGATVKAIGTKIGVVTDFDGNYKISIPASVKTLTISYIGYKEKTVNISGSQTDVSLESDQNQINED